MNYNKESAPRWIARRKHWRYDVQRDGERKTFYSSDPRSRSGPAECRRKAKEYFSSRKVKAMPPLAVAWSEYAEDYKKRNRITSYNQLQSRYKAHLSKYAKHRLADIKKADWQQLIDDAHENGAKSVRTLRGIATTIRTFCKFCAAKGYLPDADVPLYFHFPAGAKPGAKRALEPHEIKKLFKDDPRFTWWLPMFRFIVLTGLRRGEFCALQTERDLAQDKLSIRESISHDGIKTAGKTSAAQRTIYLTADAAAQIETHRRQRLETGSLMVAGSRYLFCDVDGSRVAPRRLRNVWQEWREAHGISITLHELRHTFITYSRTKTAIELDDLKEIYGHSPKMDTDGIYVHETKLDSAEQAKIEARRRLQSEQIGAVFSRIISS